MLPRTMTTRLNHDRGAFFSFWQLLLGRLGVRRCVSQRVWGSGDGPRLARMGRAVLLHVRCMWGTGSGPLHGVWGTDSGPLRLAWGTNYGPCTMRGAPALGTCRVCGAPTLGLCGVSGGPTEALLDWRLRIKWIQGTGFGSLGVKGPFTCQSQGPCGPGDS